MTLTSFKTSVGEVTADVVEIARELELEVEPKDVTELLQSQDKTWTDEAWLLTDEQMQVVSWNVNSRWWGCCEACWNNNRGLEYYVNLVDKAELGFEKVDFNLKEVLLWVKCYHVALHALEKLFMKGRVNQWSKLCCCPIWRIGHLKLQPPETSATTTLLSQQPPTFKQDPPPAERWWLPEGSEDG